MRNFKAPGPLDTYRRQRECFNLSILFITMPYCIPPFHFYLSFLPVVIAFNFLHLHFFLEFYIYCNSCTGDILKMDAMKHVVRGPFTTLANGPGSIFQSCKCPPPANGPPYTRRSICMWCPFIYGGNLLEVVNTLLYR